MLICFIVLNNVYTFPLHFSDLDHTFRLNLDLLIPEGKFIFTDCTLQKADNKLHHNTQITSQDINGNNDGDIQYKTVTKTTETGQPDRSAGPAVQGGYSCRDQAFPKTGPPEFNCSVPAS